MKIMADFDGFDITCNNFKNEVNKEKSPSDNLIIEQIMHDLSVIQKKKRHTYLRYERKMKKQNKMSDRNNENSTDFRHT